MEGIHQKAEDQLMKPGGGAKGWREGSPGEVKCPRGWKQKAGGRGAGPRALGRVGGIGLEGLEGKPPSIWPRPGDGRPWGLALLVEYIQNGFNTLELFKNVYIHPRTEASYTNVCAYTLLVPRGRQPPELGTVL